jgi:hypothetical protein
VVHNGGNAMERLLIAAVDRWWRKGRSGWRQGCFRELRGAFRILHVPGRAAEHRQVHLNYARVSTCRSGGEGSRTLDLVNAIHALSQLSYAPRLASISLCGNL